MKTKRIKKPIELVRSRVQAEAFAHDIALLMNQETRTTAKMDAEVLAVKEKYGAMLDTISEAKDDKFDALKEWASANPQEFEKSKSIDFVSAVIGFRTGMPKLKLVRGWTWDKALQAVCGWLPNFVRSKPEIDKEAIIAQRDDINLIAAARKCGMEVVQGETFYVDPKLTESEEVKKEAV